MAIPPRDGDQWRINFSRVQWRHEVKDGKYQKVKGTKEDNWVWSPQGVINMHRPETWGYLQFSTARPGTAKLRPDATGASRHLLHQIYYAQKAFHKKRGRWARSLKELGMNEIERAKGAIRLEVTSSGFEVSMAVGKGMRLSIREDSWIRSQKVAK